MNLCCLYLSFLLLLISTTLTAQTFRGHYFYGEGDTAYLQLLDISMRMFHPDPEFQNISMLYTPDWNGFIEGPTWNAWWIQNSYGATYCALPFYTEPYLTFLQNAQDLWFDQMGDGKRIGARDLQAPDGALCDAARPGWIMYKQGDGRVGIHDWGMEFTAAGLLLQAELLLISRDQTALRHYLPMLERNADFIESRRDPENDLFLAGPAANLLAPSYAGWKKQDGSYGKAYLTGLSITYIAALDRLIELEKLAEQPEKTEKYRTWRQRAHAALPALMSEEGYFIKSLDPDGTKHGIYGEKKYGYFESSPNHDAIAFRIVKQAGAEKIYQKIASIPRLRRFNVIIANEPGLDDMYHPDTTWLWQHGTWVNGGHWSTCEARMILAYYRLGKFEDARRSMEHLLDFARQFRMDNPLVAFGSKVYQPKQRVNLCYDSFGPPAAMIRGLFEYIYKADSLFLIPHIPQKINRLNQLFPVRWGTKRLFLSTSGQGPICSVELNGKNYPLYTNQNITFAYDSLGSENYIEIDMGETTQTATLKRRFNLASRLESSLIIGSEKGVESFTADSTFRSVMAFYQKCQIDPILRNRYEARHAGLVLEAAKALSRRRLMLENDQLPTLPDTTAAVADELYSVTVEKLVKGLSILLDSYATSDKSEKQRLYRLWSDYKAEH